MVFPFSCGTSAAYSPLHNVSTAYNATIEQKQDDQPMYSGLPPLSPPSGVVTDGGLSNYHVSGIGEVTPYSFFEEPPGYRGYSIIPPSYATAATNGSLTTANKNFHVGFSQTTPEISISSMFPDANEKEFMSRIDNQHIYDQPRKPYSFNERLLLQQGNAHESTHCERPPFPPPQYMPLLRPNYNTQTRGINYLHSPRYNDWNGEIIQDERREPEQYYDNRNFFIMNGTDRRGFTNRTAYNRQPITPQKQQPQSFDALLDKALDETCKEIRYALRIRSMYHSTEQEYDFWDRQIQRLNQRFSDLQQEYNQLPVTLQKKLSPPQRTSPPKYSLTNHRQTIEPINVTDDDKQQDRTKFIKVKSPGNLPEGHQFTARWKGELLLVTVVSMDVYTFLLADFIIYIILNMPNRRSIAVADRSPFTFSVDTAEGWSH